MEATSNLAHHIFQVGTPFLPFSDAFSIHNSCGIKHYEQEETNMQSLLSPSVLNYSSLSYKVKTNRLSDGFNFNLGPTPDSFPIVKTPPHLFHAMHTVPSLPHLPNICAHTYTQRTSHSYNQYRTKSISTARLTAFPGMTSR